MPAPWLRRPTRCCGLERRQARVTLDGQAYGQLCQFLPALLSPLFGSATEVMSTVPRALGWSSSSTRRARWTFGQPRPAVVVNGASRPGSARQPTLGLALQKFEQAVALLVDLGALRLGEPA